jgi:hypothetical protein
MSKMIVGPGEINLDPKLRMIKDFRLANKRAGEAKNSNPPDAEKYFYWCHILEQIAVRLFEEHQIKIWVNSPSQCQITGAKVGTTGHTYEKDYKTTPESWNIVPVEVPADQIEAEEAEGEDRGEGLTFPPLPAPGSEEPEEPGELDLRQD